MITILVCLIMLCVRFTAFVVKTVGKLLGGALGILGYLIFGVIALTLLRAAVRLFPILLVIFLIGLGAIIFSARKNRTV